MLACFRFAPLCIAFVIASHARIVMADVYGFIDEHGVRNYTDVPNDKRAKLLWRDPNGPKSILLPSAGNYMRKFPADLAAEVEAAATRHNIDPLLLQALVSIESRANPMKKPRKEAKTMDSAETSKVLSNPIIKTRP